MIKIRGIHTSWGRCLVSELLPDGNWYWYSPQTGLHGAKLRGNPARSYHSSIHGLRNWQLIQYGCQIMDYTNEYNRQDKWPPVEDIIKWVNSVEKNDQYALEVNHL